MEENKKQDLLGMDDSPEKNFTNKEGVDLLANNLEPSLLSNLNTGNTP